MPDTGLLAAAALSALGDAAWKVRDRAHLHGPTAVGAAAMAAQGWTSTGCNVEHRYRAHDVHAEVNALTNMVAQGGGPAKIIVIAAARANFTPCGSCLDWIFELGGPDCIVGFQGEPGGPVVTYTAAELMPRYPS